ncbi:MAG: hypothetical protein NBV68_04450 [Erythrobacter sp.]|uniref:hypothetical protein n=1 Tax=Erythrobacter sp. TaxID=1042 RepID=UPI0025CDF0CB|nr:hypothetical protein [Erythrobacter sp.]MCL9998608.1 hypothetical protein [Erythrobacter sp.]
MTPVLTGLAAVAGLIVLAVAAATITGLRQPSRRIYRHGTVIFAALRQDDPVFRLIAPDALWTASAQFTLIGESDAYWTDYLILPPDTRAVAELKTQPGLSDMFVAEVELTPVPALALGVLRLRHLLGLTRRPQGPLPTLIDHIEGRRELLPTIEAIAKAQALTGDAPVTMVNFLEYFAAAGGDAVDGRAAYLRYGREAFKAVHTVGGQFLFAGTITAMLVRPASPDWQGPWDDVAAMIYPDPTAIFAMEQLPAYRRALGDRDAGLKRTCVIATRVG